MKPHPFLLFLFLLVAGCSPKTAPFMPIECYSGWLQDDSFGGPCAQGVNRYVDGQQLCTWRNLLGGVQYSECFPHALEVILVPKSISWVWRYATQSGRVLQDMAQAPGGLGDAQTRRVIQEYRARQAFCDFGPWSYAFRQLLNNNWNANIHAEYEPIWINCAVWYATCYVATTQDGSVLTPEYRTLPGWSGANQIPLTVSPSATEASVTFNTIGANMSCQLVYRDTSGNIKYGHIGRVSKNFSQSDPVHDNDRAPVPWVSCTWHTLRYSEINTGRRFFFFPPGDRRFQRRALFGPRQDVQPRHSADETRPAVA